MNRIFFRQLYLFEKEKWPNWHSKSGNQPNRYGMIPAFLSRYMKAPFGVLFVIAILTTIAVSSSVALAQAKGSDGGGTNIDKATGELVEFERVGKRPRIDPRKFENIYEQLVPRLESLDARIPGLRGMLEGVLDQKIWFFTAKEFSPRNSREEQPIHQNSKYVNLSFQATKEMASDPERLKKAWLHEMVRYMIEGAAPSKSEMVEMDGKYTHRIKNLSRDEIDKLVEDLTVLFYDEYDVPARKLAQSINNTLNGIILHGNQKGFFSRPELYERIQQYDLRDKYTDVCSKFPIQKITVLSSECNNGEMDLNDPRSFDPWVRKCIKPEARKNILSSLNRLKSKGVEIDQHIQNPFQLNLGKTRYNDGYDENDYAAVNLSRTDASPTSALGDFEIYVSRAISGKGTAIVTVGSRADAYEKQESIKLTDDERVMIAVFSCAFLQEGDISLIKDASRNQPKTESVRKDIVNSLEEVGNILNSQNRHSPAQSSGILNKSAPEGGIVYNSASQTKSAAELRK